MNCFTISYYWLQNLGVSSSSFLVDERDINYSQTLVMGFICSSFSCTRLVDLWFWASVMILFFLWCKWGKWAILNTNTIYEYWKEFELDGNARFEGWTMWWLVNRVGVREAGCPKWLLCTFIILINLIIVWWHFIHLSRTFHMWFLFMRCI